MSEIDILSNPKGFSDEVISQTISVINDEQETVIQILLEYLWERIITSRLIISDMMERIHLAFFCYATYKSFLPIIHIIRLGYPSDTIILSRALMERIAVLGFINSSPGALARYELGDTNIQGDAMKWAKDCAPENWMKVYSYFTNVAHSRLVSTAGYIFDSNPIGVLFRIQFPKRLTETSDLTNELILFICYAIIAADTLAQTTFPLSNFKIFPNTNQLPAIIKKNDLRVLLQFMKKQLESYQSLKNK